MKEFNIWLIALASLFLLAPSCTKEEARTTDFSIKNASKLMNEFNGGKLEMDRGEYVKGEVYLRSASENRIAVYLESPSLPQTVYYILQTNGLADQRFESTIKNAEILFYRQSLVVNSLDNNERYLITLSSTENPVSGIDYTKTFSGFGLSRNLGDPFPNAITRNSGFGDPGDDPGQEVSCNCVTVAAGDCDSGGAGAGSCSVTNGDQSCSVTCNNGLNACCNM